MPSHYADPRIFTEPLIGDPAWLFGEEEEPLPAGPQLVERTVRYSPPEQPATYLAGTEVVLPPVTAALESITAAEVARRRAALEALNALRAAYAMDVPAGVKYMPGYEPGGLVDVLLGLITGQGLAGARAVLPEDAPLRLVQRVPLPQQLVDVATAAIDMHGVLEMAKRLAAEMLAGGMHLPRYGAVGVSGGGPSVTEVYQVPSPLDQLAGGWLADLLRGG